MGGDLDFHELGFEWPLHLRGDIGILILLRTQILQTFDRPIVASRTSGVSERLDSSFINLAVPGFQLVLLSQMRICRRALAETVADVFEIVFQVGPVHILGESKLHSWSLVIGMHLGNCRRPVDCLGVCILVLRSRQLALSQVEVVPEFAGDLDFGRAQFVGVAGFVHGRTQERVGLAAALGFLDFGFALELLQVAQSRIQMHVRLRLVQEIGNVFVGSGWSHRLLRPAEHRTVLFEGVHLGRMTTGGFGSRRQVFFSIQVQG